MRDAAQAFQEALVADPANPQLHLGVGTAGFLEHRDADAQAAFKRALTLDPRTWEARRLLAAVQYRSGDVQAAIATLSAFVADAPNAADVRATLERWRAQEALHGQMQQRVGSRFTVSFEGPSEESLADAALASLDRAYWRIGAVFGTLPNQPIAVVLYTAEQFTDITRSPSWAVGAYDGIIRVRMRGALDTPAELDRVLAHEFTHALVHALTPRDIPTWLNEGLAAVLESDDISWAVRLTRPGTQLPSLRLLARGFSKFDSAHAAVAYATSAVVVRRLLDEAGGVAVANLLSDLGEGADFDAAFLHRISRPVADFDPAHTR